MMKSMRFFVLLLMFSTESNAGMYKCKDTEGKISYSQSPCADQANTQKMTVKKDKQPVISTEDRLRRLNHDLAMQRIIYQQKADEHAQVRAYNQRARDFARQYNQAKKEDAYRESMQDYYKNEADRWDALKNKMRTKDGKRSVSEKADFYSRKAREYR